MKLCEDFLLQQSEMELSCKHFTQLHGINQVIISLSDINRNVYSRLRGSQSSIYTFYIFVFSDGPAKSELQQKCAVGRRAL